MATIRFLVTAIREDGSSRTSRPLGMTVIGQLVSALLNGDTPLKRILVAPYDDRVESCDSGPVLPLDEALRWRQPDDHITRTMQEYGQ